MGRCVTSSWNSSRGVHCRPSWRSTDRIDPHELLKILADTAEALDSAHRVGIIHRDVKPGNILITRRDGKPKIVDFGIARANGEANLTSTGMIMAPPPTRHLNSSTVNS